MKKLKALIAAHKVWSAIAAIVISVSGYWSYGAIFGDEGATRYILAEAKVGNLATTVTGNGQVSAETQLDLKSKVSGDIVWVRDIQNSQVWPGTLIAQIDARDAEKSVRDAALALENARIAFEKLKGPAGASVPRNQLQAEEDLKKAYDDGFNNVANAFLDLPGMMSGLESILFDRTSSFGGGNQQNIDYFASAVLAYGDEVLVFKKDAYDKYQLARQAYDKTFTEYKSASRFWPDAAIESLIEKVYETTKLIAESVKGANNLIQYHKDQLSEHDGTPAVLIDTYLANLNTHTGTTNKHLLSLLSIRNSIKNANDALVNSTLDIRSQELAVRQKENVLKDAQDKLADYYIRSPLVGTLVKLNVKRLDSVGSGMAVATVMGAQKIAEISLNEVDAANIKVGQTAELTFDAIENLKLKGVVSEVDLLGAVSQGVVTYNVKIRFESDDARIKPGMSVGAVMTTDEKSEVLMVPAMAVKSRGNMRYVEIVDAEVSLARNTQAIVLPQAPREQVVEVGLSNDASVEILLGLRAGDKVVARVIGTAAQTAQQAPSLFGAPAGGTRVSGGGGNVRFAR